MPKGVYPRTKAPRVGIDAYKPTTINGKRVASAEYRSWQMMKNRCLNPKAIDYSYYGGRGITVCPEWVESFDNFFMDMGPKPSEGLTLDRKDGNGQYCKENCQWATRLEQARNREYCNFFRGKHSWEWAEELGVTHANFNQRLRNFSEGKITEATLFLSRKKT